MTNTEADALDTIQAALRGGAFGRGNNNHGRPKGQKQKTETLCSGLIFCAVCGASMVAVSGTGGKGKTTARLVRSLGRPDGGGSYRQYRCRDASTSGKTHPTRRPNAPPRADGEPFTEMHIGARRIDDAVAYALAALAAKLPRVPVPKPTSKPRAASPVTPGGKRTEADINAAVDALLDLLDAGRIKQTDYDRRYNTLIAEREAWQAWHDAQARETEAARGNVLLTGAFVAPDRGDFPPLASLRLILRLVTERVEVPIIIPTAPKAYKNAAAPPWFVRVVLRQPLPDGTRSILSATYRETYQGARVILFEGAIPESDNTHKAGGE